MNEESSMEQTEFLTREGIAHFKQGAYDEALVSFTEAARLYRDAGNVQGETRQHMLMADTYCASDRQEEALDIYCQIGLLLASEGDKPGMAAVQNNIGLLLSRLQRFDEALTTFNYARENFVDCGQPEGVADQLGNMGSVCRDRKDYSQALDYYGQALQIFEELGHLGKVADQYTNIGYIHALTENKASALLQFEKARDIYEQTGNAAKARQASKNIDLLKE